MYFMECIIHHAHKAIKTNLLQLYPLILEWHSHSLFPNHPNNILLERIYQIFSIHFESHHLILNILFFSFFVFDLFLVDHHSNYDHKSILDSLRLAIQYPKNTLSVFNIADTLWALHSAYAGSQYF